MVGWGGIIGGSAGVACVAAVVAVLLGSGDTGGGGGGSGGSGFSRGSAFDFQGPEPQLPPVETPRVGTPVKRIRWVRGDTSAFEIAGARDPVIIEGSPFADSDAVRLWEWQHLATWHPDLKGVRVQRGSPLFVLEHERSGTGEDATLRVQRPAASVAERLAWARTASDQQQRDMTFDAFLAGSSAQGANREYMYYTSLLTEWPSSLTVDLLPWAHLVLPDPDMDHNEQQPSMAMNMGVLDADGAADDEVTIKDLVSNRTQALLWMSHPGVTAQPHYDRTENFFAQVMGRKRVTLIPPTHWQDVKVFPALHGSYRQSQLGPGAFAQLLQAGVPSYEAELAPGEVLYLPPLWFHRVEALDLSLSLSVVTPSEEEYVFSTAYWQAVPFGSLESPRERVVGARLFLQAVLRKAFGPTLSPKDVASALLRSRYAPLYGLVGTGGADTDARLAAHAADMGCSLPSSFTCYTGADAGTEDVDAAVRKAILGRVGSKLDSVADDVAAVFKAPSVLGDGVRETFAHDYIEELARWAVGACNVGMFLQRCLVDN